MMQKDGRREESLYPIPVPVYLVPVPGGIYLLPVSCVSFGDHKPAYVHELYEMLG